jgi:hypothetical protein
MLSILYIERRQDPENGSVGLWQLEKLLGWPEKTLEFHSWYVKHKGLIERTDSGGFAITGQGGMSSSGMGLSWVKTGFCLRQLRLKKRVKS